MSFIIANILTGAPKEIDRRRRIAPIVVSRSLMSKMEPTMLDILETIRHIDDMMLFYCDYNNVSIEVGQKKELSSS
jgi:hypothetical protein